METIMRTMKIELTKPKSLIANFVENNVIKTNITKKETVDKIKCSLCRFEAVPENGLKVDMKQFFFENNKDLKTLETFEI